MIQTIGDVGEKRLLKEIVIPLVNPALAPYYSGDDCGVFDVPAGFCALASTDRVPWDLTAHKAGIMSKKDLGHYLVTLNISDLAAMGATPTGILLNLALPFSFALQDLRDIFDGVLEACGDYSTQVLGGDLSDAIEPNLVATALGVAPPDRLLFRSGAHPGDYIFTTGTEGLGAIALAYFREAQPAGLRITAEMEAVLREQIRRPIAHVQAGAAIAEAGRASAMDNTDGLSQSLSELAEASRVAFIIDRSAIPVSEIALEVAELVSRDPIDLVLGPGLDLHLVGTIDPAAVPSDLDITIIGTVEEGSGVFVKTGKEKDRYEPRGWNYFSSVER